MHKVVTEPSPCGKLKATAVVFAHGEQTYKVSARKEVIVCAGSAFIPWAAWLNTANAGRTRTLKTPQILELSGIGRKEVLDKIGVPLKLNLPGVGENVQEHMIVGFSWGQSSVELYIYVADGFDDR